MKMQVLKRVASQEWLGTRSSSALSRPAWSVARCSAPARRSPEARGAAGGNPAAPAARTTLIHDNDLPTPPAPAVGPAQAAAASRGTTNGNRNALIWVVLALALLAGVPAAIRVIRLR
jgi:hypothetical protein